MIGLGVIVLIMFVAIICAGIGKSSADSIAFIDAFHSQDLERISNMLQENPGLIEKTDNLGYTALRYAIKMNNIEMAQFLINHGASIPENIPLEGLSSALLKHYPQDIKDRLLRENYTAEDSLLLHLQNKKPDIISMCLAGWANINTQDPEGNSILHILINRHLSTTYTDKAKKLFHQKGSTNNILKEYAEQILKTLKKDGFNLNIQNNLAETPLILVTKLNKTLTVAQIVFIRQLLKAGVDVNILDKNQQSMAMYLISKANNCSFEESVNIVALVKELIHNGLDLKQQNKLGVSVELLIQMSPNQQLREVLKQTH